MDGWCSVYACWRKAAPGSDFCMVDHGWWEPGAPAVIPRADPSGEHDRRSATVYRICETCGQRIAA